MASPPPKIDRQTTTPFLLKLFYRTGSFHRNDEFLPQANTATPPHLQIYTWPTCTLRELTHLLVTALPTILPSPAIGTRLAFRLIYPDTLRNQPGAAKLTSKELGSVVVSAEMDAHAAAPLGDLGADAEKTLQDAKFIIGDYVACAIYPPLPNGDVAGPPPPQAPGYGGGYGGRGGRPPPRENGFGRGRDFRPRDGDGLPTGEWRRGDVPPPAPAGYGGRRGGREFGGGREQGGGREYGGGFGGGYGRGRGRGRGGY